MTAAGWIVSITENGCKFLTKTACSGRAGRELLIPIAAQVARERSEHPLLSDS
jgi:hypothetical protein